MTDLVQPQPLVEPLPEYVGRHREEMCPCISYPLAEWWPGVTHGRGGYRPRHLRVEVSS